VGLSAVAPDVLDGAVRLVSVSRRSVPTASGRICVKFDIDPPTNTEFGYNWTNVSGTYMKI
jgi:hypothetical protein